MFLGHSNANRRCFLWFISIVFCGAGFFGVPAAKAQGASNDLGNGGRHTIQGRIYAANGRRSQMWGLKVRLTSASAGELSVITDESGTFVFRNLNAGSYHVVIEGGTSFEDVQESVVIDDPGSSSIRTNTGRMRAIPRMASVQIYLRPRITTTADAPPSVLNVKWANIPKAAVQHYRQGLDLVRDGKHDLAETEFRKAVEISPSFSPAYTEIGKILRRKGKLDAAIESWLAAIRYDAADFEAQLNLGIAYLNLKKYDEAETALVSAAYLDRTAVTPHYYLGLVFLMRNDLDVARKAFETARDLKGGKSLPVIHLVLGRIYRTKHMDKEAIHELETYLSLVPAAPDAAKVRQDISDIKGRQN